MSDTIQKKIISQYIKDFSFEVPHSPKIFTIDGENPDIEVGVNVAYIEVSLNNSTEDACYEVILDLTIKSKLKDMVAYVFEMKYCGLTLVKQGNQLDVDSLRELLLIDIASMLFPFVRDKVLTMISAGGFPPLLLDIIDFGSLYYRKYPKQSLKT